MRTFKRFFIVVARAKLAWIPVVCESFISTHMTFKGAFLVKAVITHLTLKEGGAAMAECMIIQMRFS